MSNEVPVRRKGLTCKTFTVKLEQTDPKGADGGRFTLEVTDTKGDPYVLVSVPVRDDSDLIALLLRRIANQKGEAGWTFDADWYASAGKGTIVG